MEIESSRATRRKLSQRAKRRRRGRPVSHLVCEPLSFLLEITRPKCLSLSVSLVLSVSLLLAPLRDIKKLADRKGVRACLLSRESQTSALCRIPFIADGKRGQIVGAIVSTFRLTAVVR